MGRRIAGGEPHRLVSDFVSFVELVRNPEDFGEIGQKTHIFWLWANGLTKGFDGRVYLTGLKCNQAQQMMCRGKLWRYPNDF